MSNFKKILLSTLISIASLLPFLKNPSQAFALVECYEVQGSTCVSAGLKDSCDADHLYETSEECWQQIPCPIETDQEYANNTQCLTGCVDGTGEKGDCIGPNNRCCNLPAPIGKRPVTGGTLNALNPIKQLSSHPEKLETPGSIISFLLADFAFYLAGLILFVMLVWGGFEMIAGAANKKSLDAGKQRVTAALIGFLLLFSVFWLAKILEMIFGIEILF